MKCLTSILAIALMALVSTPAYGLIMLSNPYVPGYNQSAAHSGGLYNGSPVRSYTDIMYDGSYRITDFHWWGWDVSPAAGFQSFDVQIYANGGDGKPGDQVFAQSFTLDALTVTPGVGDNVWGTKYEADFSTPFVGAAGRYWIGVTGNYDDNAIWGWTLNETSRIFNEDWQMCNAFDGGWGHTYLGDLTFEVSGEYINTVIPEPATLALLGLGLAGGYIASRRRK